MEPPQQYEVADLGLSGTQYTVEQTGHDENLRPEYEAKDVTGETKFQCTYQMYEGEGRVPFSDADQNELCTVEVSGTWDLAGDYLLTDSQTGEHLVVLDNDVSLIQDTWRIRDADTGTLIVEINSRGGLYTAGRKLLPG